MSSFNRPTKFSVGDRVKAEGPCDFCDELVGMTGTIVLDNDIGIGVEWDNEFTSGHDLGGVCEYGKGWWIYEDDPVVLLDEKVSPRTKVERKCHKLWNNSRFVQKNKQFAY